MVKTIEGDFSVGSAKLALIASRFNWTIVEGLVNGAIDTLRRHSIPEAHITLVKVPGAIELPVAAKRIAERGEVDGIIALGAVIKGATSHFDYVAEVLEKLAERKDKLKGYKITQQPKLLRHFTAKLEPLK